MLYSIRILGFVGPAARGCQFYNMGLCFLAGTWGASRTVAEHSLKCPYKIPVMPTF